MASPAMPSAGWATRVSVMRAPARPLRSSGVNAAGGKSTSAHRSPVTRRSSQPREGHEQVGEHAGALAALPGVEQAHGGARAVGGVIGRRPRTPRRGSSPPAARAASLAARSARSSATTATWTGRDRPATRCRRGRGAGGAAPGGRCAGSRPTGPPARRSLVGGRAGRRPEEEQLGRPLARGRGRRARRRGASEHGVEVRAAEAERADAGAAVGSPARAGRGRGSERAGRRRRRPGSATRG